MGLLIPETGLLFWMLLSFTAVLLILLKYGFPVILDAADKRRATIEESLETAKQADEKLASADSQSKAIIDRAHQESNAIFRQAQETSTGILEQARQAAEKEAAQRLARAKAEAQELKRQAISEVMEQIAGISVKIASKVVEEDLKAGEGQKKLIERMLDEEVAKMS